MDDPELPVHREPIQPIPPGPPAAPVAPARQLPFSQQAIWGFVISCVSLFVFGFIGALGVVIASRGYRAARLGQARGRGLAIAGMIIGAVGFLFYVVIYISSHLR